MEEAKAMQYAGRVFNSVQAVETTQRRKYIVKFESTGNNVHTYSYHKHIHHLNLSGAVFHKEKMTSKK